MGGGGVLKNKYVLWNTIPEGTKTGRAAVIKNRLKFKENKKKKQTKKY